MERYLSEEKPMVVVGQQRADAEGRGRSDRPTGASATPVGVDGRSDRPGRLVESAMTSRCTFPRRPAASIFMLPAPLHCRQRSRTRAVVQSPAVPDRRMRSRRKPTWRLSGSAISGIELPVARGRLHHAGRSEGTDAGERGGRMLGLPIDAEGARVNRRRGARDEPGAGFAAEAADDRVCRRLRKREAVIAALKGDGCRGS